ncbi:DUF58 domain-containing protein [Leisingera thetidis]|uniref:DUF58 domain-containing protein n=1 Tax=Leisingera thetidis TaxID=2930199 RepID=UPI0021F78D15|nr:DUF58 domain-containing protein [Leisingera thetidis]
MTWLCLGLAAVTVLAVVLLQDSALALGVIWGGLALAAACDLLLSVSSRNLVLETDLPDSGFSGLTAPFTVHLTARRGALPPRMELRLTLDDGLSAPAEILLEPRDGGARATVPLGLRRRGLQAVRAVALRYRSRLGMFEILPRRRLEQSITVLPNIQPVLSGEVHTRMLPLLDGHRSAHVRGEGSEFHQLRDFVPGMDPRKIDWKRSARVLDLVARETRAERNHQIMICVDHGHLMSETIGTLSKLDHAINNALALCWAGGLGGDTVGFYTFGPKPGLMIPPGPGRTAFARMRAACSELQQSDAETNHTLAMSRLYGALNRRSLVVVFSDFSDSVTAELLVENMAVMSRHHLVLYVALRDSALDRLAHPETLSMETIAHAVSAARFKQERAGVLDRLNRLGVLCLDTGPETLTPALLARYTDIKLQGLI